MGPVTKCERWFLRLFCLQVLRPPETCGFILSFLLFFSKTLDGPVVWHPRGCSWLRTGAPDVLCEDNWEMRMMCASISGTHSSLAESSTKKLIEQKGLVTGHYSFLGGIGNELWGLENTTTSVKKLSIDWRGNTHHLFQVKQESAPKNSALMNSTVFRSRTNLYMV
jgi:hypothetical protein